MPVSTQNSSLICRALKDAGVRLVSALPETWVVPLIVVTVMGAVAGELQSTGHGPNFFYLQHAMGLASSVGLGIALARPHRRSSIVPQ